jgi:cellulose synthase (UDP-forming)
MMWLESLVPGALALGYVICLRRWFDYRRLAVRTSVLVAFWLLQARYFYWRATSTLPEGPSSVVAVAWGVLLLELGAQLLAQLGYARSARHYVDRSAEADAHADWWRAEPPLVDLFIPTYNEGAGVLLKTLAGARYQDYPRLRVWVLDDGKRDWLQELCEQRGVNYIRRSDNQHYKSGNLNNALAHVQQGSPPDFIAVLDADFVPKRSFVSRCMALMYDPKTALVQTPQEFFNADPIQYAFGSQATWPDDLRFLFCVELRGLDGTGNSSCCGTSFLIRRSALDRIGGFPTESVAEDLLTAVKLGRAGLRCVYLKEHLSSGLAAEGMIEHLNQRARWVHGLVEVGRSPWAPAAGAPWPLSWFHFAEFSLRKGAVFLQRHVFLWIPIAAWWTGHWLYQAELADAARWILPLIILRWALVWLEQGATLPLISDVTTLLPSLAIIRSTAASWLRPAALPFVVTAKGTRRDRWTIHWRLVAYFGGVLGLTSLGLIAHAAGRSPLVYSGSLGFLVLWSAYDILVCGLTLVPCLERPKYRASERFATSDPVTLRVAGERHACTLVDLSTTGAAIDCGALELVPGTRVTVDVPSCAALAALVVRRAAGRRFGVAFQTTAADFEALVRKLYCSNDYIHPSRTWSLTGACVALGRRAFGLPALGRQRGEDDRGPEGMQHAASHRRV